METLQHQHQTPGAQEHISDLVVAAHLSVVSHTGVEREEESQNLEGVVDIRMLLAVRHIAGLGGVVAAMVAVNRFQVMGVGIGPSLEVGAEEPQLIVPGDNLFQ